MSWTKRQIIDQALREIGIRSYSFDSTADQIQDALRQLDAMMAGWINSSIIFVPDPYPISTDPTVADLDEDTNAPGEALLPMYALLAMRLAPSYGKTVNAQTILDGKAAYSALLRNYTKGTEYKLGTFLKGAGNKDPLYPWQNTEVIEEEVVVP